MFGPQATIISTGMIFREKAYEASILFFCLIGGISSGPWLSEAYFFIYSIFGQPRADSAMPLPVMLSSFFLSILLPTLGYLKIASVSRDKTVPTLLSAGISSWLLASFFVPFAVKGCQGRSEFFYICTSLILLLGGILAISMVLAFSLIRFFPKKFAW